MTAPFTVQHISGVTVIEFKTPSLMDPVELEDIGERLYRLVDEEDHRHLLLDFERVQFLSSQAIGLVMKLQKKLSSLKNSRLVLCSVGPRLLELLKITRLDRVLTVKPSQQDAMRGIN